MPHTNLSHGLAVRSLAKTFASAAAVVMVAAVPALGIANIGMGLFAPANSSEVFAAEQVAAKNILAFDGPAATAQRIRLSEREANSNLPAQGAADQETAEVLTNWTNTATKTNASVSR